MTRWGSAGPLVQTQPQWGCTGGGRAGGNTPLSLSLSLSLSLYLSLSLFSLYFSLCSPRRVLQLTILGGSTHATSVNLRVALDRS